MFLEILVATTIGCLLGSVTGITPSLHINMVAVIILGLIGSVAVSPLLAAVCIVAMSITHCFVDFIPSVFLGAPESETALSALPGHVLLLKGRGYEAVFLSVLGGFASLLFFVLLIPLFIFLTPLIFESIKEYIGYILLFVLILATFRSRDKIWSLFVVLISGLLGILVLNSPIKEPLLPLFSGLFGMSLLLMSLNKKIRIPEQEIAEIRIAKKETAKSVIAAIFSGSMVSIFPGLGPAQSAIIARQFFSRISRPGYLILLGGISSVSMLFSLITLLTIGKARNGSIVVVQELVGINSHIFLLLLATAIVSSCAAVFLSLKLARIFSKLITRINYARLCFFIIAFIILIVLKFSGLAGLIVLITSTAIGIVPNIKGVERSQLMACLLVPIIMNSLF